MCKFQVINHNSFGCIIKCPCCQYLHLGFGNVLTAFSVDEFNQFANHIERVFEKNYSEMILTGEKIYLNTDSEKFVIALNPDELSELNNLLSEAQTMLQVNQILNKENIID